MAPSKKKKNTNTKIKHKDKLPKLLLKFSSHSWLSGPGDTSLLLMLWTLRELGERGKGEKEKGKGKGEVVKKWRQRTEEERGDREG